MSGKEVKLDALGQKAEKALMAMLDEVTKKQDESTPPDERITMLEKMRVIDRVLKWQAIKLKAEDDEGGFFNFGAGEEPEDTDEPKGAIRRGRTTKAPG